MASPPGTSKQKKGIRQLLKDSFSRPRSRSPSQSLLQPDPRAPTVVAGSGEGQAPFFTNPGVIGSSVDHDASAYRLNRSSIASFEQAGAALGIPSVVEPIDIEARSREMQPNFEQEDTFQAEAMMTSASLGLVPDESSDSAGIPTVVEGIEMGPNPAPVFPEDPSTLHNKTESEVVVPICSPPNQTPSQNMAWNELRRSLRVLKESSNLFARLPSAIESLLSCLDGFEVAVQSRQDFEDLATELTLLSESMKQYTGEPSSRLTSGATTRVAIVMRQQAIEIKEKLDLTPRGGVPTGSIDEEEMVEHYRQIQSHFRRLQMNARMSTQSITNEHIVNTRLENLSPAKQAAYDSSLSTEINRRGCTEGTRMEVLDGLDSWLHDSKSSPIYWMNGMAGTGKTSIASTFCERAERCKLLAASFFCTRNSAECRDVTRIVPTIAYQLARYSIPFQSALCKILGQTPDIGSKNILKQFELLLTGPLQQVKDTIPDNLVVVIDALDECDDRNGAELLLDILFRHAVHLSLKFMVMSRPEPEIYEKMSAYAQFRDILRLHDIEESLVRADIELYLKEELEFMLPSQDEVDALAQRSGTLFIYAATLVKYISGRRSIDPRKRLRAVLDITSESTKKYTQIDSLYKAVLESALSDDELNTSEVKVTRAVLQTVLLAQEPINVEIIANLADIRDLQHIMRALQPLRSVLHQSQNGLVSTLHASFPDFMFNSERSGSLFCDRMKHSQPLAQRCFLVMEQQLRFNICNLASSFVPDEKVGNLQQRIKENISPTLAYSCRYWASHLVIAPKPDSPLQMLDEFLSLRLLFWMEVLSLRRELPMGVDGLLKVQKWLAASGALLSELLLFVDDARSFLTGFAVNPSSQSTPHIYLSSLAFCPQSNLVYKHYRKRAQGLLELKGSLMERREAAPLATWTVGSEILSLALSPDGTRVAIGCLDNTVSILSAYDGLVQVGPLQGHPNSVNSVAFSPDGGRIVSASLGSIRVWNAYNGTRVSGLFKGHMRYINSVSFSPDGTRVVSGGHDSTVRIWNAYDGTALLHPLTDHTDLVLCVSFSPDGDLIASASADQTVRLWDSHNGTPAVPPFQGHTGTVDSLAFTPDGTRLVSGAGDKTIRVWDRSDGSLVNNFFEGYTGSVNTLATSPDSTRIAAGCYDNAVRVWNIDDGKLVAGPFFGHTSSIKSVAYSPDGTRVLSGSSDRTIRVWNVRDGMLLPPPLPSQSNILDIRTVIFSPDSTHFLSSGGQNILRLWDANDGSFITIPEEASFFPTPLSILSPDGSYIASTSKDGLVQVTSTKNGSLVAGPFEVERSSLSAFWFSHNNKAIIMGCHDGTIKVCNLHSGNVAIGSFMGHHRGVSSLAESPDCSLLVSHSNFEFALRVWKITIPALDLEISNIASIGSISGNSYVAVYDGWNISESGWVVNHSQDLLFWLPPDVASAWCSPYAILAITKSGTLRVPKQRPLIGHQWTSCYISE
ncbi:vegetative incompatibility protein HET-E-1 [Rhizoctonia solani AG-3 Rhs1AP]|uniref:Vegetative incompatibility protein HET-E-1 n=2 Tax=Rhizoctonia solani AG-3 TaxID=1086053 RepID=A0A074RMK5_9AGAM|nr:vegetative incompatibility protein HET-E-1 [Rhizoctonia solani AG-3 Rhs1AP]KEP45933.1 vegetative incompatibility protein HET-E-1 [Rhizoctonia solani 123E]